MARQMRDWLGRYIESNLNLAVSWKKRHREQRRINLETLDDEQYYPTSNSSTQYREDGSNLRVRLYNSGSAPKFLQLVKFTNFEDPVKAIVSDSFTSIVVSFSTTAAQQYRLTKNKKLTHETLGHVLSLKCFEIVATPFGPSDEKVSLLIEEFTLRGGLSQGDYGRPSAIEQRPEVHALLHHLSELGEPKFRNDGGNRSYTESQTASDSFKQLNENDTISQKATKGQITLVSQVPFASQAIHSDGTLGNVSDGAKRTINVDCPPEKLKAWEDNASAQEKLISFFRNSKQGKEASTTNGSATLHVSADVDCEACSNSCIDTGSSPIENAGEISSAQTPINLTVATIASSAKKQLVDLSWHSRLPMDLDLSISSEQEELLETLDAVFQAGGRIPSANLPRLLLKELYEVVDRRAQSTPIFKADEFEPTKDFRECNGEGTLNDASRPESRHGSPAADESETDVSRSPSPPQLKKKEEELPVDSPPQDVNIDVGSDVGESLSRQNSNDDDSDLEISPPRAFDRRRPKASIYDRERPAPMYAASRNSLEPEESSHTVRVTALSETKFQLPSIGTSSLFGSNTVRQAASWSQNLTAVNGRDSVFADSVIQGTFENDVHPEHDKSSEMVHENEVLHYGPLFAARDEKIVEQAGSVTEASSPQTESQSAGRYSAELASQGDFMTDERDQGYNSLATLRSRKRKSTMAESPEHETKRQMYQEPRYQFGFSQEAASSQTPSEMARMARRNFMNKYTGSKTESRSRKADAQQQSSNAVAAGELLSGAPQTSVVINDTASRIFKLFASSYDDYGGDFKHFKDLCHLLDNLSRKKRALYPSLWDDFIVRHKSDYCPYILQCSQAGDSPMTFEQFYDEIDEESTHRKAIMSVNNLHVVLGLVHISDSSSVPSSSTRSFSFLNLHDSPISSMTPVQKSRQIQWYHGSVDISTSLQSATLSGHERQKLDSLAGDASQPIELDTGESDIDSSPQVRSIAANTERKGFSSSTSSPPAKSTSKKPRDLPWSKYSHIGMPPPALTPLAKSSRAKESTQIQKASPSKDMVGFSEAEAVVSSIAESECAWWKDEATPFKQFAKYYSQLKLYEGGNHLARPTRSKPGASLAINVLGWKL